MQNDVHRSVITGVVTLPASLNPEDLRLLKESVETSIRLESSYINRRPIQDYKIAKLEYLKGVLEDALLAF